MRKLSLLAALGIVLALGTGVSAAATSPSLTSNEYQQLVNFEGSASAGSLKTLGAAEALQKRCRSLSAPGRLMRTYRADCNASIVWVEASLKAVQRLKACAHTHTLATRFACLGGAYERLEHTVRALYRAELGVYRATVARGFTGACVRALSDGPKALADEKRMGSDLAKMLTAMRGGNLLATQKWGSLYDAATAESESAATHASIGACPHQ